MKATLSTKGSVTIEEPDDLLLVFRYLAELDRENLLIAVGKAVKEKTNLSSHRIQTDPNFTKIVAIISDEKDEGSSVFGNSAKPPKTKGVRPPYRRNWKGFYHAAKDIFDELRAKKKKEIRFDDFYQMILDYDDPQTHGKLFVKKDEDKNSPTFGKKVAIEKSRVRQYLSDSQVKKTPQVKGVKYDKFTDKLSF